MIDLNKPARILGIESSCDETAAAVVVDGRTILSSVVASQFDVHRKYGGVVPELASREHLRQIVPVVREAMSQAGMKLEELDAIGVTQGPGLVGSLLVGITYGKTLAQALGKPLLAVNHLAGHVHAAFLEAYQSGEEPKLPAVCLIVSGGHTVLYEVRVSEGAEEFAFRRIGQTRDDAAGEAYDKVAKLLALGYPGGPMLDRLAAAAAPGIPAPVKFGPTKTRGNPLDFSFSGLKTAVLYHVREHPEYNGGDSTPGSGARGRETFVRGFVAAMQLANAWADPRIPECRGARSIRTYDDRGGRVRRRNRSGLRRSFREHAVAFGVSRTGEGV